MKNHPENRLKNPQANPQTNQPTHHRPENNLIKRYLNRITKNNNSIIIQEKKSKMKTYPEKFIHSYTSSILGEYYITYQIYRSTYQDYPTEYTIKITNSLTDEECYLEEYPTYDEAIADINRINKLIQEHTDSITYNL